MKLLIGLMVLIMSVESFGFPSSIHSLNITSVTILDNPPAKLVHSLSYRKFDWDSGPRVILEVESAVGENDVGFRMKLGGGKEVDVKQILKKGLNYVTFSGHFNIHEMPTVVEISSKDINGTLTLPKATKNFRLSGKVIDMDGKPVVGAWVVVLDAVFYNIAITDVMGAYEMRLPLGEYDSIAAFDKRYPTERLEDYYWNLTLSEDKKIDFRIGNAEIFRLTVGPMKQNRILAGTFIAYSSNKIRKFLERENPTDMNHPGFMASENTPDIKSDDIQIILNGCPLEGPILLERTDILSHGNQINKNLGYKFEVSYASCPTSSNYNELEIRLLKKSADGRARIGSLKFL